MSSPASSDPDPPGRQPSHAGSRRRSRSREERPRAHARKRSRSRSRSLERRSRPRRDDDDARSGSRRERSLEGRPRDRDRGRDRGGERDRHRDREEARSRDKDGRRDRRDRDRERGTDGERTRERERGDRGDGTRDRDRGDRKRDKSGERPKHRSRDDGDRSRSDRHNHHRHRRHKSPSPPPKKPPVRLNGPLPSQADSFARQLDGPGGGGGGDAATKERPNFGATGFLAREANTVAGRDGADVVLRYHEPADARAPPAGGAAGCDWRLYVFKGDAVRDERRLAERSCWLLGTERAVVDLPVDHPSASGQHAVVQFRAPKPKAEGVDGVAAVSAAAAARRDRVRPYLIDLESKNGTVLNGERIEPRRFVEIRSGDVMRIGHSEREYVFVLPPREGGGPA